MRYHAFGLGLSTSEPIPRLGTPAPAGDVDIRIELRRPPDWVDAFPPLRTRYRSPHLDEVGRPALVVSELGNAWLHLAYSDTTTYWIEPAGREVWATWADTLTLQDTSSYLLGPVMGLVLRLRGRVCLHASAFVANGRGVGLVGPSGCGKSTTAAALGARGHAILADDVLALEDVDGVVHAYPGYPRLRLWPAALDLLGGPRPFAAAMAASSRGSRYHLDVTRDGYTFQQRALPLGAIYVLGERANGAGRTAIDPIAGSAGLMALVAQSFTNALLDGPMRAHELHLLATVASGVRIARVVPSADGASADGGIAALCDALLDDLQAVPA
jgi:hypothetical protein